MKISGHVSSTTCGVCTLIIYCVSTEAEDYTRPLRMQIAEDYACADLILRLPGHAPMPAFRASEDVPLVVRHARRSRQQVRFASTAWRKLPILLTL